jgi:hypothetical protein
MLLESILTSVQGYDPFQVDFNYLLRELDNQNPEISLNVLSFTGRDNEERPDGRLH